MKVFSSSQLLLTFLLLLFLFLFNTHVDAQLAIDTTLTKEKLVETLIDNSVYFDSIKLDCHSHANGVFSHETDTTGLTIDSGIILSTGRATYAMGPNDRKDKGGTNPGYDEMDKDLSKLANNTLDIRDKCVLEFDIVPIGDEIRFNYIFASEEYPEYIGSEYNDVFGFFVSGPGIKGPYENNAVNIAILDTIKRFAVAINTVNSGEVGIKGDPANCNHPRGSLGYSNLYNDNSTIDYNGTGGIQYDGFTKKLEAKIKVQRCKRYHFKLAIADIGDSEYDSGVFIEKNSFKSNITLAERSVQLPSCTSECGGKVSLKIVEGTAADYQISWTKDQQVVETQGLSLDGICEGSEVKATIQTKEEGCKQVINVDFKEFELTAKSKKSPASGLEACNGWIELKPSGGIPPYSYRWSNKSYQRIASDLCPGEYAVTITDKRNCELVRTFIIELGEKKSDEKVPTPEVLETVLNKKNHLYFEKNQSSIKAEDHQFLTELADALKADKGKVLEITGHASGEGAEEYNLIISKTRAEQVKNHLLKQGVKKEQLSVTGKGEKELYIKEENSESDRQMNRRVELRLKT